MSSTVWPGRRSPFAGTGAKAVATLLVFGILAVAGGASGAETDFDSLFVRVAQLRQEGNQDLAQTVAQELARAAEADSTIRPYQRADARRLLDTMNLIVGMPAEDRAALAAADGMNGELVESHGRGDFARVIELATLQHETYHRLLGPRHRDTAEALNNVAEGYRSRGQVETAEPYFRQAQAINEEALGLEHPDLGVSLNGLAAGYVARGRYAQAEALFKRVRIIWEKALGGNHPNVAGCLNNLGTVYLKQGDDARAEQCLEASARIFAEVYGPDHDSLAKTLGNLGRIYILHGQYARGDSILVRACDILVKRYGNDQFDVAGLLNGLARSAHAQGHLDLAEEYLEKAAAIYARNAVPDHPNAARTFSAHAWLCLDRGEYGRADAFAQRALSSNERNLGLSGPEAIENLTQLGASCLARGLPDSAIGYLAVAGDRFEAARLRVGSGLERATFQKSPYLTLAAAHLLNGDSGRAWSALERANGRALGDLLAATKQRPLSEAEAAREKELRQAFEMAEQKLAALIKAAASNGTEQSRTLIEDTRLQMLTADARYAEHAQAMSERYPVSAGLGYSLDRVQSALNDGQAIVGWLDLELGLDWSRSWAYVIRNRGPVDWLSLTPAGENQPVSWDARVRRSFGAPTSAARAASLDSLSALRVRPMLGALSGISELIVVAAGELPMFPLEALTDDAGKRLLDRFAISYTPSATIYAWLKTAQSSHSLPTQNALLIGDPPFNLAHKKAMEYEAASGSAGVEVAAGPNDAERGRVQEEGNECALPRLLGTRTEIAALARLAPKSTVLLGPAATEQDLVRMATSGQLSTFSTIHLATHAFADARRPERSRLILSQVDLPDPVAAAVSDERICDGQLTVQEILREWRLNADLVTLSACDTGQGKQAGSEGMVGLAHAFLQAGARSLVVSLWAADDRATARLMMRFYENMWQRKLSKADALCEAKQWLCADEDELGRAPYSDPRFWSGFVLIGDRGQ